MSVYAVWFIWWGGGSSWCQPVVTIMHVPLQDFIQTLQKVGPPMGFQVGEPYAIALPNDRTDTILREIGKKLTDKTQMVRVNFQQ